ncbi:MAG: hypothetical protein JO182_30315 [Acidobacteriaceae bacterium]|nr:hypothetical protein [Acidobacteriaceae bacterium]MBV9222914.1 hypothetical protein [Acidobacteriaceae bacterium]
MHRNQQQCSEPLTGWREVQVQSGARELMGPEPCANFRMMCSGGRADYRRTGQFEHTRTSFFYVAFAPAKARRLTERCEFHYTPNTAADSTGPRSNSMR